ncbi:LytR/AlgR family response regulator transcription factor [Chitinophagaceae bacterium MMS25-I14]
MKITALIVDDEEQPRDALQELLLQFCPEVEIVGITGNIEEAIRIMRSAEPDILFLDIHLGEYTGFDLLNRLYKHSCDIIFTTAYENFALKAFEYAANNYLLKPINYQQLIESVHRVKEKRNEDINRISRHISQTLQSTMLPSPIIALSDMTKTDFVQLDKIVYLESKGAYTLFHLHDNSQYIKSKNLKYYEDSFHTYRQFVRVHKSYIVNKSYIKTYIKTTSELECNNGAVIPTTLGYKTLLKLIS